MKPILQILIFLLCSYSFGQSWIDSVVKARNAYFKKDFNLAARTYQNSLNKLSGKHNIPEELAQTYYRNGQFDQSAIYYKKKLKKANFKERVRSLYNLGNVYQKQGNYKKAINTYKRVLKLDPYHERARYNLSQLLRKLRQKEDTPKNDENKENNQKPKESPNKDQKDQPKNKGDQKKDQDKKAGDRKKNGEHKKDKSSRQDRAMKKNTVDRMLKALMKAEAATKRRLNKLNENSSYSQEGTGKDW